MIKHSLESGNKRNIPHHNKSQVEQTLNKYYPQVAKIETISSKLRNKTSVPTLTTAIQYSFGSPNHSNQRRKRNKRKPNWKIIRKLSLLADYMILDIENPKDAIRKSLE